jgi:ADP-ribosylglycohydrolase
MTLAPTMRSRFRGCLLGGAVGDALGGRGHRR